MDRVILKNRAKAVLKKYYVVLLIVSLVIAVSGGSSGGFGRSRAGVIDNDWYQKTTVSYQDGETVYDASENQGANLILNHGTNFVNQNIAGHPIGRIIDLFLKTGLALASTAIVLGGIAFILFIAFPLRVGGARIFIDSSDAEHAPNLGRFAFAFRGGHYANIVIAGFLTSLYQFLWSLLFVIPGIVKRYAYSLTPFILADNPEMSAAEAIRFSQDLMRGHKMEMFILDLSFIGWYILGAMFFGIGKFLVYPYKDATVTQFYIQLRADYHTRSGAASGGMSAETAFIN